MALPIRVSFVGCDRGRYHVERIAAVRGEPLAHVIAVERHEGTFTPPPDTHATWSLRGTTSHQRYTEQREAKALAAISPALGRSKATCAALIPIRKSEAWWDLAQDERRAILEQRSHHIALGMSYLPAIARRLYHARELGEPFDFLTWFEYAPSDVSRFEELVAALRDSEEWRYVDREVDIRLRAVD
jgi:chlorite dismutase